MKLKTFLTNFGLYLLAFLSYLFIFFTIVAYTVHYLAGGFSQLLILPIFVILASLYSFAMWKWYQKDLELEIKNTKLTSSIWLPSVLLLAFIIFQQLVPIESSANQNTAVQLIQQQPGFAFFYIVIFAPILEELLVRGFLAKFLFPDQKSLVKILIYLTLSSSLFSLLHMPGNLVQFLIYFILGAIFGLGYLAKKDLRYSMGLHLVNNLIAFVLIVFF
ncbi:CPBP family intramembrane glutamic endopeptidase [Streptococcus sanguinis]|uniref:Putative protease n=1 Tax=Streptococcus sanguinis TaxID=1305 RepID=A0A0B7GJU5_STRSA|nr:CPBP family intramembrane glutamic endopeptidase [Streptococcus sanguinis]CEL89954.1 putative protease [Streptococcus sanguinis]